MYTRGYKVDKSYIKLHKKLQFSFNNNFYKSESLLVNLFCMGTRGLNFNKSATGILTITFCRITTVKCFSIGRRTSTPMWSNTLSMSNLGQNADRRPWQNMINWKMTDKFYFRSVIHTDNAASANCRWLMPG